MRMRLVRAVGFASLIRAGAVAGVSLGLALTPAIGHAQSAADKATARALATEGIKLYQAGRYAEALDRLQRAEALYDSPVHLLYIARAQVKLDKLVDGAETYRRLARVQLDSGAAATQKQAVEAAGPELAELEPRIPSLRLDVEPANVSSLEIRIDGEKVPAAIIGVERPMNPGTHKVQVWAPGFNATETTVELKAGEKKPVQLRLEPGASAPPPEMAVTTPAETPPAQGGVSQPVVAPVEPAPVEEEAAPSKIGFMAGLRVAAAIPLGSVGSEASFKDILGAGGGGELHGGVRFAKYFTGLLYFGQYFLKPGPFFDVDDAVEKVEADNKATAQEAGLGIMFALPVGKIYPFAELDIAVLRRVEVKQKLSIEEPLGGLSECTVNYTLSSSGLAGARLVGGVQIPLAKFLNLAPYVGATIGKFKELEVEGEADCPDELEGSQTLQIIDPKLNTMIVIGVGGDFVFGGG